MPRLHEFYKTHPDMLVQINLRIDAAIVVGNADFPGLISHRLHTEELMVIMSPQAAEAHDTWTPEHIGGHPPKQLPPLAKTRTLRTFYSTAFLFSEWVQANETGSHLI
jgi:DNA-binding transcriptional LysR family regulator